jgi:hypothetical protein
MVGTPRQTGSWWKRLAWLILIWAASVAALGAVAWAIRLLMHSAGLVGG